MSKKDKIVFGFIITPFVLFYIYVMICTFAIESHFGI